MRNPGEGAFLIANVQCLKSLFLGNFASKTNLAVSSTEFCQALFDERDVRESLSGGCGHGVMIPPL